MNQTKVFQKLRSKKYLRLQSLLLDWNDSIDMTKQQIAGVALAMYAQGGELLEELSKLFLSLNTGEEEEVLELFEDGLRGAYRDEEIVRWLVENRHNYQRDMEPVIEFLDRNPTQSAYHVL